MWDFALFIRKRPHLSTLARIGKCITVLAVVLVGMSSRSSWNLKGYPSLRLCGHLLTALVSLSPQSVQRIGHKPLKVDPRGDMLEAAAQNYYTKSVVQIGRGDD